MNICSAISRATSPTTIFSYHAFMSNLLPTSIAKLNT